MADRTSLGFLGFFFGGVTFTVAAIAVMVVSSHVNANAKLAYDDIAMTAPITPVSMR